MKARDVLMIAIGAIFGWAIIWLLVTFTGFAVTALGTIFAVAFPVFAVVGFVGVLWWVFFRRKGK